MASAAGQTLDLGSILDRGLVLASYTNTGAPRWATAIVSYSFASAHVAFDGENAYVAGAFDTQATLGTTTLMATGPSNQNVFVARYTPTGALSWAKASSASLATAMCVGSDGSVSVGGGFASSATFGGTTVTAFPSSQGLYSARYDQGGAVLHAELAASSNTPLLSKMRCTSDGRVYFAGTFLFDIEVGGVTLSSTAQRPAFVAVWNP